MKSFAGHVFAHLIGYGVIYAVGLAVPIISVLAVGLAVPGADNLVIASTAVVSSIAAAGVTFLVLRAFFPHRLHFPAQKPKFAIRKQVLTYKMAGGLVYYTKEKTLRALVGNQDHYVDTYRWTGTRVPTIRSLQNGQSVQVDPRKTMYKTYRINFNRHLKKNEEIDTELLWEVVDKGDSAPFVSTTIEEPTDRLIFRFQPPPSAVSNVYFEKKFSIAAKEPFETVELTPDRFGVYEYEVRPKPKLYYYYEVRWVLAD